MIPRFNAFSFRDLFQPETLQNLDRAFLSFLIENHPQIHASLIAYRLEEHESKTPEISEFLISCAVHLEQFLVDFFDIEEEAAQSQAKTLSFNPIAAFKKYFVLKHAKKEMNKSSLLPPFGELDTWLEEQLEKSALYVEDKELHVALLGMHYLQNPETYRKEIEQVTKWCIQALTTSQGQMKVKNWTSFHLPKRIDHQNLCEVISLPTGALTVSQDALRLRDGFQLTDKRMNAKEIQDEINYCIYCHDHEGDFCSKGFPVKKGDPTQGFKKNALDNLLIGCPLEEKISEMQLLKRDGHTIGALAMIMVDNPMCPATGHRICNDCMKACVYQKQDPVNVPQIETRVLTDVLDLPWGVEIYDLLTRWNPLRHRQWIMKSYNGSKIMIAGMGPAGFTLAHHLLQEGFAVVGFDGLKIEPLPKQLIHHPIKHYKNLKESLDERIMSGFGGVAEYGITVRWDKNFLKLIYLTLSRRPTFQVFGSTRFGGTITIEDAWEMGFDHFVVAVGAGLPKALMIPGSLAPGMRQANDFLMALQLGNAAKTNSLTNLQVRLPAVIIGGGLTGVDAATEIQAYYISQVEKILYRYEILAKQYGQEIILQKLDIASKDILQEYLAHGLAVRKERQQATQEKRPVNFIKLIHTWGGVTIIYRRSMQESPAYLNNHEELQKALQEGVFYLENMEPIQANLDKYGHVESLGCHRREKKDEVWVTIPVAISLPARTILVATGTQPNIAYEFEHKGTFNRLNLQYQHYEIAENNLLVAHGVKHSKDPDFGPFTSYHKNDKRVSLIGDTHPVFHGSVVKAIASGMRTYPKILKILAHTLKPKSSLKEYELFASQIKKLFEATVTSLERKSDHIVEVVIHAPIATKHYKPGQFYRLQNFETDALHIENTLLQMEPLALMPAECDKKNGLLRFIILENSVAAKIVASLKPGQSVSLMGPTGVRAKIPEGQETILILGDESSIACVRNYGTALREAGNRVIYVNKFHAETYCQTALEAASDMIIWMGKKSLNHIRDDDYVTDELDYIKALIQYGEKSFSKNSPHIKLSDVDRILLFGDADILKNFQAARKNLLKPFLLKDPKIFASVYGNMQCMLKGVCAQCLQWQIHPETGLRTKAVFTCSWQDQPLEIIDIDHMAERKSQNFLHETINYLWIDYLFENHPHYERI